VVDTADPSGQTTTYKVVILPLLSLTTSQCWSVFGNLKSSVIVEARGVQALNIKMEARIANFFI
jgi:hypothetical protein